MSKSVTLPTKYKTQTDQTSFAYLGHQSLEEAREALVLSHVRQDPEAAFRVVEVSVLDTGLDDIEGCRDDKRGGRASNRGDKVLEPGGLVVVLEMENPFLRERRTTKEGE